MTGAARARLPEAIFGLIVLLLVQFTLGIATNLFVTIPLHHSGSQPGDYFTGSVSSIGWAIGSGGVLLAAHAILGIGLVLSSVRALVLAIRVRERRLLVATAAGGFFILGAAGNGASFLDYQHNVSSMIMASLFALAMLSYVLVLFWAPRQT